MVYRRVENPEFLGDERRNTQAGWDKIVVPKFFFFFFHGIRTHGLASIFEDSSSGRKSLFSLNPDVKKLIANLNIIFPIVLRPLVVASPQAPVLNQPLRLSPHTLTNIGRFSLDLQAQQRELSAHGRTVQARSKP